MTPQGMARQFDVAVIGGGAAGLSAAVTLQSAIAARPEYETPFVRNLFITNMFVMMVS